MANLWVIFPESIHGPWKDLPFPALSLDGLTGTYERIAHFAPGRSGNTFADFYNAPADDFGGDGEFNFFPPPPFVEFFFPQRKMHG
jgi:hypothetical protein